MPNVIAGLGLLSLGVVVMVAVGTLAYSLFTSDPLDYGDEAYSRSQGNLNTTRYSGNLPVRSSSTVTIKRKRRRSISSEYACSDSCSICKESIVESESRKLPCNHWFHYNCISDWFKTCASSSSAKGTCPMCRKGFSHQDLTNNE